MPTGSGEVDLDALLEDLCVMERDMTSSSETDSMFSETISSPIINSPISPKMKVCCEFFILLATDTSIVLCLVCWMNNSYGSLMFINNAMDYMWFSPVKLAPNKYLLSS